MVDMKSIPEEEAAAHRCGAENGMAIGDLQAVVGVAGAWVFCMGVCV